MAQRMVRTIAWPAAGPSTGPATGSQGRRSSRRAQPGSSAIAAAARAAYGPRAASGSGGSEIRNRAASRACGMARFPPRTHAARRRVRPWYAAARHAESGRDPRDVADVTVAPRFVERAFAVALMAAQEAVRLRDVHPAEQVRVVGPVGRAVGAGPGDPRRGWRGRDPRPAGRPARRRTWSPRGTCWCAAAGPRGRRGNPSAARSRSWRLGCSDCSSSARRPPTNIAASPCTRLMGRSGANQRGPGVP